MNHGFGIASGSTHSHDGLGDLQKCGNLSALAETSTLASGLKTEIAYHAQVEL